MLLNSLRCDALVDTSAAYLTLPTAWKERLGDLEQIRTVDLEIATQEVVQGSICGPVRIEIEGFAPTFGPRFCSWTWLRVTGAMSR